MFASVIFTTYNHPQWLEKTLWGFSAQSYRDFEIIVADDGSEQETRDVVESIGEITNRHPDSTSGRQMMVFRNAKS